MNYKLQGDLIGLDLGKARTGVARISTAAKLAEPLEEIIMNDNFVDEISDLVANYQAIGVVIGIPRGLDGQDTQQSGWAKGVLAELKTLLEVPVFSVDEAATTKKAEEIAKPQESIDSVAAGIILDDFIYEVMRGNVEGVSI